MIREIVKIDEGLCNGCGVCVPGCHEGALQIIDGKARLISDLMCDGLGACLNDCPEGAITIEKREAEAYDEIKVIKLMLDKGQATVIAHLKHLKDHNETVFLKQAVQYLKANESSIDFDISEVIREVHNSGGGGCASNQPKPQSNMQHAGGGCPGSQTISFDPQSVKVDSGSAISGKSELRQWPVQMHLINPNAAYFKGADVVIAADCVAFALGDFHSKWLKGKSLAVACPKLDSNQDIYVEKLRSMIDDAKINTLTLMIMQVPCCGGLTRLVISAKQLATRIVPVKMVVVSIEGTILSEEWI